MRILVTILFLFLASFNGCVNHTATVEMGGQEAAGTVLSDQMERDLMNLYSAATDSRNALQQESSVCFMGFSVRVLPQRTRTISNVSIRQVLLSTHKPVISTLMHHPITQLVAFPKEYHVFQLRRILV